MLAQGNALGKRATEKAPRGRPPKKLLFRSREVREVSRLSGPAVSHDE